MDCHNTEGGGNGATCITVVTIDGVVSHVLDWSPINVIKIKGNAVLSNFIMGQLLRHLNELTTQPAPPAS
jgi:hypothetical protein